MLNFKSICTEALSNSLDYQIDQMKIEALLEVPKNALHGDLAFPCFTLARLLKKSPAIIAQEIAGEIHHEWIDKAEAIGPYVNVFFSKPKASKNILANILAHSHSYGNTTIGKGKTIVLDFSSPNIAKPFSMGHLRSTVIGNALANIAEKCGYHTVRINHLGDWGTQFGKLITAYRKWGSASLVEKNPIQELFKLYIKFHEEAEANPDLDEQARYWFKELENGNNDAIKLWKWFREESLNEFKRIYDLLGITFDSFHGEAFYNDKMEQFVSLLDEQKLLEISDGAKVVRLNEEELPPCLIKKADGATLYATRDLAAADYRFNQYKFFKALYVVGQEQTVHFKQVKAVLRKLGYEWSDNMIHVPFGLYLKNGKKMSTRKGRVVLLEDVLKDAIRLSLENIENKNPNLPNKEEIARDVGVGAVMFHDLKNDRMNNIEFSLEDMLTFEGETGPYIQYTNARAHSILRKAANAPSRPSINEELTDPYSWEVIKLLNLFEDYTVRAFEQLSPAIMAKYIIDLAQAFNKFYGHVRILEDNESLQSRLSLVKGVTIVLEEGLKVLGINSPKEM